MKRVASATAGRGRTDAQEDEKFGTRVYCVQRCKQNSEAVGGDFPRVEIRTQQISNGENDENEAVLEVKLDRGKQ